MDTQTNYKRTVAGSVGAGMGAIFNGSGRTYYMLEHKTSSKYHQAGETQKIIIDQVELGRDASCQVRFDESFETVSRKHAAIERDGDNWKLVHLSASNPTLVNGRPIQGSYYLQSGDEIQLSVNGPRLGFIVPQGKQALTSSIKLTERMNLFRQQALAPYKKALWALAALLVLVIAGFGYWNYSLTQDNNALKAEMATYQAQMDSLSIEKSRLDSLEQQIQEKLASDPDNEELKTQLTEVQEQKTRVVYAYNTASSNYSSAKKKAADYGFDDEDEEEETTTTTTTTTTSEESTSNQTASEETVTTAAADGASEDIASYYNDIYTMKVKRISLERDGNSYDPGIAASSLVVGTGFVMNGKFVTARSNIQPWVYRNVYANDDWRRELAEYVAAGFKVIIDFEAYSTRGSGHPLRFSNIQFDLASLEANDATQVVEIRKDIVKKIKAWGIDFVYKKSNYETYVATFYTDKSHNAATLALGAPGGLPIDRGTAQSLKGGEQVTIAGFSGRTDIQNLSSYIKYFTSNTSRTSGFNFITLQSSDSNWGFTGAPAFYKTSDGGFRVVGVNVGNFGGEVRVVPINKVY
jgi:hypothetical protein